MNSEQIDRLIRAKEARLQVASPELKPQIEEQIEKLKQTKAAPNN